MVARSSLCPFERRAWNDVPLGANVLSLYQLELIKEGGHNFQVFALQELKKRGIDVKLGEDANSLYQVLS